MNSACEWDTIHTYYYNDIQHVVIDIGRQTDR